MGPGLLNQNILPTPLRQNWFKRCQWPWSLELLIFWGFWCSKHPLHEPEEHPELKGLSYLLRHRREGRWYQLTERPLLLPAVTDAHHQWIWRLTVHCSGRAKLLSCISVHPSTAARLLLSSHLQPGHPQTCMSTIIRVHWNLLLGLPLALIHVPDRFLWQAGSEVEQSTKTVSR